MTHLWEYIQVDIFSSRFVHQQYGNNDMSLEVKKKIVSRTGIASFGWQMGHGHVSAKITVKSNIWCVLYGNKVLAECRSKAMADTICSALDSM